MYDYDVPLPPPTAASLPSMQARLLAIPVGASVVIELKSRHDLGSHKTAATRLKKRGQGEWVCGTAELSRTADSALTRCARVWRIK